MPSTGKKTYRKKNSSDFNSQKNSSNMALSEITNIFIPPDSQPLAKNLTSEVQDVQEHMF